jgi:site-specific DNA-adenine methylase
MKYPGGKGNLYHKIINLIPPHEVYIETHLGGGAVMRHKRPALASIGIDIDAAVVEDRKLDLVLSGLTVVNADAAEFLADYQFKGNEFVYCDPPYVMETRKGGRIYRHEYTIAQHKELLKILIRLPCNVMISGYLHSIYTDGLSGWNVQAYLVRTRGGGRATEFIWMNYQEPIVLHDYRVLGDNFRERERIQRKVKRWKKRLMTMPDLERQAVLSALVQTARDLTV